MNERLASFNEEQRVALNECIVQLKGKGLFDTTKEFHSQEMLAKFFWASDFKLEKTIQMWTECLEWRKENGVDSILEDFRLAEEYIKQSPRMFHKTDRWGRVVCIVRMGKMDLDELKKVTTAELMLKSVIYELERLRLVREPASARQCGHSVSQTLNILDLSGASIFTLQQAYQWIQKSAPITQKYYPDSMHKLLIINAPYLFTSLFKLAKKYVLEKRVVNKIEFISSGVKARLLEYIDEENLPDYFGGSCDCNSCSEIYDIGPWNELDFVSDVKTE